MDKVELLPAHFWICDNCGAENFERGLVPEISEAEELQLKEEYGFDEIKGHFMVAPSDVKCPECETQYEADHSFFDDEEPEGNIIVPF
jgi:rubrerythrin